MRCRTRQTGRTRSGHRVFCAGPRRAAAALPNPSCAWLGAAGFALCLLAGCGAASGAADADAAVAAADAAGDGRGADQGGLPDGAGRSDGEAGADGRVAPDGLPTSDTDGAADAAAAAELPPLPLRAAGRFIVDATGRRVKLAGVNWAGGHLPREVPDGLDVAPLEALVATLRENGFNSVRLTFSNEMVETNPVVAPETVAANPRFVGARALDVFDATIAALNDAGILVILNNHTSDSVWCCGDQDDNMLWYNERYPESAWIADWQALALRYRDVPAVVGVDLRNEPRFPALWDDGLGPAYDWPAAAERAGNAVLETNPDWLVFVEGIQYAKFLTDVPERPIVLALPGRLVYSAHDYAWFHAEDADAATVAADLEHRWGYLLASDPPGPMPVWLGEFGTNGDGLWFRAIVAYLAESDADWCWWRAFADEDGFSLISAATLAPRDPVLMEALRAVIAPR